MEFDFSEKRGQSVITFDDVSYDYKSGDTVTRGVRNVNLAVKGGSFTVLLGANGSGKSTLAKLTDAFMRPDSGVITVFGCDTRNDEDLYKIRSSVGMVFQNPDNQTVASIVEDDVAFGPENLGVPREEIDKRITWALEKVGMSEYRHRSPVKLSGGQKQRIAIATALAMLPAVLILDESTSMLDPKGRKEVLDTVKKLNKEHGVTVVLITHYMDEAVDADQVFVMDEGTIIRSGSPEEVFADVGVLEEAGLEPPLAAKVSAYLRARGLDVPFALTDEQLAEGVCRLK